LDMEGRLDYFVILLFGTSSYILHAAMVSVRIKLVMNHVGVTRMDVPSFFESYIYAGRESLFVCFLYLRKYVES
jgi:hypothetical protein